MKERKDIPSELINKLEKRKNQNLLRELKKNDESTEDFSSNDYLGLANEPNIANNALKILQDSGLSNQNGAKGSRLLNGNHELFSTTESFLADTHKAESALIYNSGYTANIGLLTAVLLRNNVVVYDELIHASLRDAIQFSPARSYKFSHNQTDDLEQKLKKAQALYPENTTYLVTEAVFSMDGDIAPIDDIKNLCLKYNVYLIIDEAHATGTQVHNEIEEKVKDFGFARILTFGKSLGAHGACVLCSDTLKEYLINFSRSFIYTTALSPHSVAVILASYQYLTKNKDRIDQLKKKIQKFRKEIDKNQLTAYFLASQTPIQSLIIKDNAKAKRLEEALQINGYDIRAILSPTVQQGTERLRICLHTFNSDSSIEKLMRFLRDQLI